MEKDKSEELTEDFEEIELPESAVLRKVFRLPKGEFEEDWIVDEVPISLVYNGISHVVMMGTPKDLKEFAIGFSLTEGIIKSPENIYNIEIVPACGKGIEVHLEISPEYFWKLKDYRRSMAGRTGCGICGTESLDNVQKPVVPLPHTKTFDLRFYQKGLKAIEEAQVIGHLTGATHAVVALGEEGQVLGGCEDVGRHVAMDKLIGKMADRLSEINALFLSSRASFEMVQKAAMSGVEIVFAVSAPTLKAVEFARQCNMTLVAFSRSRKANVYCGEERLSNMECFLQGTPDHQ